MVKANPAKRIFLLRHSKAGWAQPGMKDFDRPLDDTGLNDAQLMGSLMRDFGYTPEITLCSSALRTRETLQGVAAHTDTGRIVFSDMLYSTDASGYLDFIKAEFSESSMLVIGHNPTIEEVALMLSGSGEPYALASLGEGYPTSGLAVIDFDETSSRLAPGAGFLTAFHLPERD